MTKKDYKVIANIISMLSFSLNDGCFIIGDGNSYDALMIEELHDSVNNMLKETNPNYDEKKFWDAVYQHRKDIIDAINNH